MALKPGLPLTVTSSAAVRVDTVPEEDYKGSSNVAMRSYGQTVTIITDGPVHVGGDEDVTNTGSARGSRLPAGVWTLDISGDTEVWLIAPSGPNVTVERFQVGV